MTDALTHDHLRDETLARPVLQSHSGRPALLPALCQSTSAQVAKRMSRVLHYHTPFHSYYRWNARLRKSVIRRLLYGSGSSLTRHARFQVTGASTIDRTGRRSTSPACAAQWQDPDARQSRQVLSLRPECGAHHTLGAELHSVGPRIHLDAQP